MKINKKVYIACPISKYVREGFDEEFLEVINGIYDITKTNCSNVYFPLKKEAFGEDKVSGSGEICTPKDHIEVTNADIIIALPETSMGVSVEIGWASEMKKEILIFIDKKYHQSELIRYIDTITPAKKVYIDTSNGYLKEKDKIISELKKFLLEGEKDKLKWN